MIQNPEIISVLKATIDHNAKEAQKNIKGASNEKEAVLIKASFDEIMDGHFNLLKIFVFIDLVETNKLNLQHLNDLVDEHIEIIKEGYNDSLNDAAKSKLDYNVELWTTIKQKMNGYMELLSPVE